MDCDVAVVSRKNYSEAVDMLERRLAGLNLSHQAIMTAMLLMEEVFLCFERLSGGKEGFSVHVALKNTSAM